MTKLKLKIVSLVIFFSFFSNANAQFNQFHPEYKWLTIEGENIYVHFNEGAERTAKVVAKIADEVWGPITSLYEYEPDKVHYIIKDIDDYSNGATYFFDNKIEIWASALDFNLRGNHNWLRNVISHEFTHMVQIQAGMKWTKSIPAFYVQYLDYQDVRRPDLLYGYPDVIISYPLPSINIPAWFAEGTAQYMRKEFEYENWDTHRDMILRSYVLDDNMLTWNQMGVFGKTSLGNESVYNSGFAFTQYIAQEYGEDKLRKITHKLAKFGNFSIDAAFEDVLEKDGNELYDEWKKMLFKSYTERIKDVKDNLADGELLVGEGFGNFYPAFSKDNSKLYYVSNKGEDYFSQSSIYEYDFTTGKEKMVLPSVRSSISLLPDDNKIVYAKLTEDNPKWAAIHDLYIYDFVEEESTRLTNGLRANNPSVSPDGNFITFIFQKDGTTNIGLVDINGKNFKRLTFFENGEQVYSPKFSNDGSFVVFDYSYSEGRDIAKVNVDGSGYELIIKTEADERDAVYDKNGNMYFVSDETGIFNVYKIAKGSNEKTRISNVVGSTFMPAVDGDGNIVYAGYTSTGFKLFKINSVEQNGVIDSQKYNWVNNPPLGHDIPNGDINNFDVKRLKNYNDYELPDYEIKPYSGFFSRMTFFPFIRYDNYNLTNDPIDRIKPGVYIASSDYLNRFSLFGSFAINKRLERDFFVGFEYRDKLPLLYSLGIKPQVVLELYSVSRRANVDLFFGVDSTGGNITYDEIVPTDVTYDLFEFDIAFQHKVFAEGNNLEFRFIYSDYTATLGSFIIPNIDVLYPSTSDKYFIGRNFQFKFTHKSLRRYVNADINPVGRDILFQLNYEIDDYNGEGEYEIEDGLLLPVYTAYNFARVEVYWKEYMPTFKDHTFNINLRGASIIGPELPTFFDYYIGGLVGMKGYPFYSIGGNQAFFVNLSYRFPLFKNIDGRWGPLYLDKIFASVYFDVGDAWTGKFKGADEFKKGAGAEIRIKMSSFYLFPTSIFFNAAYGLDRFNILIRGEEVTYGQEWILYAGVLFDFSF